jgi:hypothetical protein
MAQGPKDGGAGMPGGGAAGSGAPGAPGTGAGGRKIYVMLPRGGRSAPAIDMRPCSSACADPPAVRSGPRPAPPIGARPPQVELLAARGGSLSRLKRISSLPSSPQRKSKRSFYFLSSSTSGAPSPLATARESPSPSMQAPATRDLAMTPRCPPAEGREATVARFFRPSRRPPRPGHQRRRLRESQQQRDRLAS